MTGTIGLVQSTPPDVEPLTLDEAKEHLKFDMDADDPAYTGEIALIESIIVAARERAENRTHRQIITASWTLTLDTFPSGDGLIEMPLPSLQSVESIKYFDTDKVEQTLSTALYEVDIATEPGRIKPIDGEAWPDTNPQLAAVTIEFTCGYGDDGTSVPESLKNWMKILITNLYENRTSVVEGNVTNLEFIDGLLDAHIVARL